MKKIIIILSLFSFVFIASPRAQDEAPRVNSNRLDSTVISAYLQQEIESGKNLIFCSAFQIAWNELIDEIVKESIQLEGAPLTALMLNQRLTGKEDISQSSYVAMAGFNKDGIVEKIKKALRGKFNQEPSMDINLRKREDILAYAFLLKDLKFGKEFESLDEPIRFNNQTGLRAFGIEKYALDDAHRVLGAQVRVIDYKNNDDFIISLKSVSGREDVILAKISPKETLIETIESVSKRVAASAISDLKAGETLQIPKLNFDILHEFKELTGKPCLNANCEFIINGKPSNYNITKAIQAIRFRLDEKGALLKSEAAIVMEEISAAPEESPRSFIFDKPFLLYLKEDSSKYPYFAIWVDNPEVLLKK